MIINKKRLRNIQNLLADEILKRYPSAVERLLLYARLREIRQTGRAMVVAVPEHVRGDRDDQAFQSIDQTIVTAIIIKLIAQMDEGGKRINQIKGA